MLCVFGFMKRYSILSRKQRARGHHEKIYLKKRRLEYDEQEKTCSISFVCCNGCKYNVFPCLCCGLFRRGVESAPLNGLHQDKDGVWRYYKDDVFQADYTGFVEYAGRTFYVSLGTLVKVTDLIIYENEWYYLVEGELVNYNGVVLYDGKWFYVSNGRLDTNVNGIVPYDGAYFVFVEGRLADEQNGLWINDKNEGYWTTGGRVCMEYTGVAMYDNAFFYIVDGKFAKDYNGTVEYDGATFRVENGQLYGPIK